MKTMNQFIFIPELDSESKYCLCLKDSELSLEWQFFLDIFSLNFSYPNCFLNTLYNTSGLIGFSTKSFMPDL